MQHIDTLLTLVQDLCPPLASKLDSAASQQMLQQMTGVLESTHARCRALRAQCCQAQGRLQAMQVMRGQGRGGVCRDGACVPGRGHSALWPRGSRSAPTCRRRGDAMPTLNDAGSKRC